MPTNDEVKELGKIINEMTKAQLEYINRSVGRRFKALQEEKALENLATLEVGDRIRTCNVKPKYLSGLPGTIININEDQIQVEIDPGYNTRRYTRTLRLPASCVQKEN